MATEVNDLRPFCLDEVKPRKKRWGLTLSLFWLDTKNKYGQRAQLLKPNVNTSYF